MPGLRSFLKTHTLWAGFVAVLVPLLILLGLQSVWLARLERVSTIAHKAGLSNYLEAIGTEVQYFYRSNAERALNLPAPLFLQGRLDEVALHWRKKPIEGVTRLFLVDYTRQPFGNFLIYDADRQALESAPASEEGLAIIVACTPWQVLSYRGGTAESLSLNVDERNPDYRMILNPITDDASRVIGLAGMILSEEYFRVNLLPKVIEHSLPNFFPGADRADLVVTVRDGRGQTVLATGESSVQEASVVARFPFVFSDWTVGLHSLRSTPEQWARANFAFNMTLSVLLAAVLIGEIMLVLRAANRAMKLSEMKSDFVSNVSHELRTPLASIRVFAELLRLGKVQSPEKVQEYGEYMDAESRRLSRLIDNILDFSRIESGRKTYQFVRADLREVVAATLKSFEIHLKPRGWRIALEAPENSLPLVLIDPDAIAQAFHNLLDNAVKYSGDSKEIAVRLVREGNSVVLSVQDHGIGIPRDEQRKVFERFHRVSTGLVHEVQGSGLGLSIVQHIARVHGGKVSLLSEPGKGSTFTIHLPVSPGPNPAPRP
jgi:signal transduction histidine kinase